MTQPAPAGTAASGALVSLPVQLTELVGREREVAQVRELTGTTRLLTLTGAGGSGKTRVALEVARRHVLEDGDEVAWVELASVQDPNTIGAHVASALGARGESARPIMDTLRSALVDRRVLLVLDNCEHLIEACAQFVDTLLRLAPSVRVLATSRQALGIGGERSWLVPVLSLPAAGDEHAPERGHSLVDTAGSSDAVRLFVQRARDVQPAFTLTEANAEAVAAICRRVDGLPLAIELAAARVRVLTPDQIASRLDDAFRVLGSGRRTALPRHRTLREAIDWSVRLLDDAESRLLARLSVFAGDFSLERAEAVCSDDEARAEEILDTLSALVDKSLVVMHEAAGSARYRLLETIRQYAAEQLAAAGAQQYWQARHATVYCEVVRALEPMFITRERAAAVSSLAPDIDDVRAALRWSHAHAPHVHLRLAGMLTWFWYSIGAWSEGRRWMEQALLLPQAAAATRERAALLFGAGAIAALQADNLIAQGWLTESAAIARDVNAPSLHAYARNYLCMALASEGHNQGEDHAHAALDWFERTGDLYGHRLALLLLATGDLGRNDLPAADMHAARAVTVARDFGVHRELGIALQVHGTIMLMMGNVDGSDQLMREALASLTRDPQPLFMARAVDILGVIAVRRGDPLRGIRFTGAASAERERVGAALFAPDRERLAPHMAAALEAVGSDAFATAWQTGRHTRLSAVIDEVLHEVLRDVQHAVPMVRSPQDTVDVEREIASAGWPERESSGSPALEVRAMGRLRILRNGIEIAPERWRSAKPRELLVYLLMHPEGRTREQIGLVFWPDASASQVKNNFHVTLHHLRKTLGASDWVVFEGERYRVNRERGVYLDALELADVLSRHTVRLKTAMRARNPLPLGDAEAEALLAALGGYTGDLLADEAAGDWHLEPRDALRREYAALLELAGSYFERQSDNVQAATLYRRLVGVDPLHEAGYRALMRALVRIGARTEALRQYDRLAALLASELETTPDRETRTIRDRIARGELTAL